MAAYISFGVSPAHLLSASVMSAPAALACSKLLYPETEESQTGSEEEIELSGQEVCMYDCEGCEDRHRNTYMYRRIFLRRSW